MARRSHEVPLQARGVGGVQSGTSLCWRISQRESLMLQHTVTTKERCFVFHLSPRLCPSAAGCSPPSMPSSVVCPLLSCSRWFPYHLLLGGPLDLFPLVGCHSVYVSYLFCRLSEVSPGQWKVRVWERPQRKRPRFTTHVYHKRMIIYVMVV